MHWQYICEENGSTVCLYKDKRNSSVSVKRIFSLFPVTEYQYCSERLPHVLFDLKNYKEPIFLGNILHGMTTSLV